jgi:protein-tyrosine phosphatase
LSVGKPSAQPLSDGGPLAREERARIVAQILPNLFLGNREAACNLGLLRRLGVVACVNCTEFPHLHPKALRYHHICVPDSESVDICAQVDSGGCVPWVERQLADRSNPEGSSVLVYCQQGVSRSCAVTLALCLHLRPTWTLITAWQHVKRQRPKVRPNMGFCHQLVAYEQKHRGQQSARVGRKGLEPRLGANRPSSPLPSCRRV